MTKSTDKKTSEQIENLTTLIKKLISRVEELEENVKERENEIDDIFSILNAT